MPSHASATILLTFASQSVQLPVREHSDRRRTERCVAALRWMLSLRAASVTFDAGAPLPEDLFQDFVEQDESAPRYANMVCAATARAPLTSHSLPSATSKVWLRAACGAVDAVAGLRDLLDTHARIINEGIRLIVPILSASKDKPSQFPDAFREIRCGTCTSWPL